MEADPSKGVAIARFAQEAMAHMAAGKLAGEGIDARVFDQLPTRALGARGAVIIVPAADAERATAVLANSPARNYLINRPGTAE